LFALLKNVIFPIEEEVMKGRKVIFKCVYGSHLFGLNTEKSDKDFKGIVIPSKQDFKLKQVPKTSYQEKTNTVRNQKNTQDDTDCEWFTLEGFLRLCAEGQTVSTEMLFCPESLWLETSPTWFEIIANRDKLIHSGFSSFFGYARQQAYKYSFKGNRVEANRVIEAWASQFPNQHERLAVHLKSLEKLVQERQDLKSTEGQALLDFTICRGPQGQDVPHLVICGRRYAFTITLKYLRQQVAITLKDYGERALQAAENNGADWKALSHALRVGNEAIEFLSTGSLTFPRPEREYLLAVKNGLVPYAEVQKGIEGFLSKIPEESAKSKLPEKIDEQYCKELVDKNYKGLVKSEK
jgi:hypothetical protein